MTSLADVVTASHQVGATSSRSRKVAVPKAAGVSGEIGRRALMLSGDLTRMAEIAMTSGEDGLRDVGFEIFRPILPMLASTSASVADAISSFERASVEWKLDGIRIQI